MKRYKVIDTSSFQRLNIKPGASPSDGELPSLPDWRAVQQPIYGRFRPVPGRPDRLEVRDPQGRRPPFVEPLLPPGRTVSSWPEVLVYGEPLTSVNRFSTRDGLRFASTGGTVPMNWVMAALGAEPTVPVLFVEPTLDGGTSPQISVVTLRFDGSGRATPFRRRSLRLASRPHRIIGNQGVRQPTSSGDRLLAVYMAEFDRHREIWLAEVDDRGALSVVPLADDRGVPNRLSDCVPAITSSGAVDSAFLAYATEDELGPTVVAGELRRDPGGVWSFRSPPSARWPLRHPAEDTIVPASFAYLASDWDAVGREVVLAATKPSGRPFLARYDRLGNRLRLPQVAAICNEQMHGSVRLLVHPVTGRVLYQQHHNYFYYQRGSSGFTRYDGPGGSLVEMGDCSRVDPFGASEAVLSRSGRPYVGGFDEVTQGCVSPTGVAEFLVGGAMYRPDATPEPYGGLVGNSASAEAFVSLPNAWPLLPSGRGFARGVVLGLLPLPALRSVLAVLASGHDELEPQARFSVVRL